MIQIPLTRGAVALIDDADYAVVSQFRWSVLTHRHTGTVYAKATVRKGGTRTTLLMHRLVLGLTDSAVFVDHANRDGLDNRRANLRIATRAQNGANRLIRTANKTGFRGVVYLDRYKVFRAQISVSGVPSYIGSFKTAEEAHAAYLARDRELFGEFFAE